MTIRPHVSARELRVAALGILTMVACGHTGSGGPPVVPAPPTLLSLEIPSNAFGNGFSGVTPAVQATGTVTANYFVLPLLSTTSPVVRVNLRSPYPSDLTVTATDKSSGQTVILPQLPAGSPGPATGAFQVVSVTTTNPANWLIVIRYPNSFQGSKSIATAISDVVGGVASAPLSFSMSFRGSTVTVSIATANNDGRVTSNPPGINCPGTCSFDFLSSTSVVLGQSVTSNATEFTGWTGSCVGSGNTCTVQLLAPGPAIIPMNPSVTANFRLHSNTPIPPVGSTCPAPPMVTGMRWVTQPNCGTIPISQGANLMCDAQGWFCCGVSGGAPTSRCPGGNQTNVTCSTSAIAGGPVNQLLIQPGGCYESVP
jgi:hypothetical protein